MDGTADLPRRTALTVFLEILRILLISRIGACFFWRVRIASLISRLIMVHPFDLLVHGGDDGFDLMEDLSAGGEIGAMECTEVFAQPVKGLEDRTQIKEPSSLGTFSQRPRLSLLDPCPSRFEEEGRLTDHFRARGVVGFLVVAKPGYKFPCGDPLFGDPACKGKSMCTVGARQRYQHPGSRPTGEVTGADELDPFLIEDIEQMKASGHPTGIFSQEPG